jgi:F420H(2)-dependent quinone reductase
MTDWNKLFAKANVFVYQKTKGHFGNKMGKQSVLLLNTIGRKSGMSHTTTLSYYREGNSYLVVASNWGKESNPDWMLNLMQQPHATIQVKATTIAVEVSLAQGEEYRRLWELVTRQNSQYLRYQTGLKRKIPIVILSPTTIQ